MPPSEQDVLTTRRPWQPSDGDTRCQRCGGANPVWRTNNALWNEVIGGNPEREAPGIVCPTCFMLLAEMRSIAVIPLWHLSVDEP